MQHDFVECLTRSHEQSEDPIWERVYKNAFHNFGTMYSVKDDGWAQRGGIDRMVTLTSGRTLAIDEKCRFKDYGDILVEVYSNEAKKIAGWACKDLACDFIAYGVFPQSGNKRCYLIPFIPFRKAVKDNGRDWGREYGYKRAQNNGYVTTSIPVPTDVLFQAVTDACCIKIDWLQA